MTTEPHVCTVFKLELVVTPHFPVPLFGIEAPRSMLLSLLLLLNYAAHRAPLNSSSHLSLRLLIASSSHNWVAPYTLCTLLCQALWRISINAMPAASSLEDEFLEKATYLKRHDTRLPCICWSNPIRESSRELSLATSYTGATSSSNHFTPNFILSQHWQPMARCDMPPCYGRISSQFAKYSTALHATNTTLTSTAVPPLPMSIGTIQQP